MKKTIEILTLAFVLLLLNGCEGEKIENPIPGVSGVTPEDNRHTQNKGPVTLTLGEVTATTVTFDAHLDVEMMADYQEVGLIYSTVNEMDVESETVTKVMITKENYSETLTNLSYNTDYYYTIYLLRNNVYQYGVTQTFKTNDITISIDDVAVTATTVAFTGKVVRDARDSDVDVGIAYGTGASLLHRVVVNPDANGNYTLVLDDLTYGKKYVYKTYIYQGTYEYGNSHNLIFNLYDIQSNLNLTLATDLSSSVPANCYLVSTPGLYKFIAVLGNSMISIDSISSAAILWESFGTKAAPEQLDLISGICYKNGYIIFKTAEIFKEGNAVIAAKDASGNILWSWHIWFTDDPNEQIYKNDAGIMMDRNLGATSATPGDAGALGLLYQWGRKDPFLGSSSISGNAVAKSTITWPSVVSSDSNCGTIEYTIAHPTTFIVNDGYKKDWYYTGSSSDDNTLWTTSESTKSLYDPCPSGWRVPDGGENGVWSTSGFPNMTYVTAYEGIDISISSSLKTWYPASGCRYYDDGTIGVVGDGGRYWSASPCGSSSYRVYTLSFNDNGYVDSCSDAPRAYGYSVRCVKE